MSEVEEAKSRVVEAVALLFATRIMSRSGHGNASMRVSQDRMVITGVPFIQDLDAKQMVLAGLDGQVLEGDLDPAVSEIVHMHADVYRARADVGAVIHTHSPKLTAFAMAGVPLPCVYESALRQGVSTEIPVAAWAPRGSAEAVSNIVRAVEDRPEVSAVLLANHGVLAFTESPRHTAQLLIALEEAATVIIDADPLGGAQALPEGAFAQEQDHMRRHGSTPN